MVWNYSYANQENIIPKLLGEGRNTPEQMQGIERQLSDEGENQESDNKVAPSDEGPDNKVDSSTLVLSNEVVEKPVKKKSYKGSVFTYVLLILVLLALSLYYAPKNDNFGIEYEYLVAQLGEMKLNTLNVTPTDTNGQESMIVSGYVESEAERSMVQDLARSLHYPVYLQVGVENDLIKAAEDSFNLSGVFPSAEFSDNVLHVSGYMKDGLVEEIVFANLKQDVKNLPQVQKNILYGYDLAYELEPKLAEAYVPYTDIAYNTGQIVITGLFDATDKSNIHKVMNEIMDAHQMPLLYMVKTGETIQVVAEAPKTEGSISQTLGTVLGESLGGNISIEAAPEVVPTANVSVEPAPVVVPNIPQIPRSNLPDPLGGIKISAVSTGAIPFVTTSDGQRLFKGAMLQSGYVIDEITADSLTLRKGAQVNKINLNSLK